MKLEKISILLLAVALASCGGPNQGIEQANNTTVQENNDTLSSTQTGSFLVSTKRFEELKSDLSNIETFALNINRHVISVEAINTSNKDGRLECKYETASSPHNFRKIPFSSLRNSAELTVDLDGDKNTVSFDCSVYNSANNKVHSFETEIAKGYVVLGTQSLSRLGASEESTVVMMENAELLFGNFDPELKIDTLISHNAHISTFTVGQVNSTPDNHDGHSGGRLKLSMKRMLGEVTINLRGQNAGRQTQVPSRPPQRSERGASGNCPRHCDGAQGPQGLPANDGLNGFNGGSTGAIDLLIEEKTDAFISINYMPGKGSSGSQPSLPGIGGLGGLPDSYEQPCIPRNISGAFRSSPNNKCVGNYIVGKTGPQGPLGPQGRPGDSGYDGVHGESHYSNIEEGVLYNIHQNWKR